MKSKSGISYAIADIFKGFKKRPFWVYIAFKELRLRYARSFIGPFWITLTMAFWVFSLSALYGGLFGAPLHEVAPFITLGVILWTVIATSLNEAAVCLGVAKGYFMQSDMPVSTFVWLVVFRNFIIACHHMVIYFVLMVIFKIMPNANWAWLLIQIPIFMIFVFGASLIVAVLTPRFRDIGPLINNLTTVGFFLTPVMWRPSDLVKNQFITHYNPFAQLLEIVRNPFLGLPPTDWAIKVSIGSAIFSVVLGLLILAWSRKRLAFWL